MITISRYKEIHQTGIDRMMQEIATEFEEPLFSKSPVVISLPKQYWVALHNREVIGTVALITTGEIAILKKMMLKKAFRGTGFGVSQLLLKTSVDWCHANGFEKIYLGTMNQFKAAQQFYEKNGFVKITANELPQKFINNPIDDVFYLLDLQ